jgi:hypothetical protein
MKDAEMIGDVHKQIDALSGRVRHDVLKRMTVKITVV